MALCKDNLRGNCCISVSFHGYVIGLPVCDFQKQILTLVTYQLEDPAAKIAENVKILDY